MAFTYAGMYAAPFRGGMSVAPQAHNVNLWGESRTTIKEAPQAWHHLKSEYNLSGKIRTDSPSRIH